MAKHNRQAGFGIIEIIILLLLLVIIFLLIWYVFWGSKDSQQQSSSNNVSQNTQQAPADPRAGWKEYCSPLEKSCFKYPSDWTFQKSPGAYDNEEIMQGASPKGTTLNWNASVTGIGGNCDPNTTPTVYIKSVKAVPNIPGLYVTGVGHGPETTIEAMGLVTSAKQAPQPGDTGDCIYAHTFKSKDGTRDMWLSAGSVQSDDISTLELILTSFHY